MDGYMDGYMHKDANGVLSDWLAERLYGKEMSSERARQAGLSTAVTQAKAQARDRRRPMVYIEEALQKYLPQKHPGEGPSVMERILAKHREKIFQPPARDRTPIPHVKSPLTFRKDLSIPPAKMPATAAPTTTISSLLAEGNDLWSKRPWKQ